VGFEFPLASIKWRGEDVQIHGSVVIRNPELVTLGSHISVDEHVVVSTALETGDYVHIGPHCSIIGGKTAKLHMADFTTMAAGARVACNGFHHLGEGLTNALVPEQYRDSVKNENVYFERFVVVCTNSFIMPGVTLGEGSVIGAMSFINKSTEPWKIYGGIPARVIKDRPKERMIAMAKEMGY
jgi:acetyltransferase-like isoleucine patch superfamily enzyme